MLSLYIHVPFCERKCDYCGFYSTRYRSDLVDRYLEALEGEIRLRRSLGAGRTISSMYIGGGTPSLLSEGQMARLVRAAQTGFSVSTDAEVTCEVNPNSSRDEVFRTLKRLGVTRISIGVQSLDRSVLASLGRLHTPEQAVAAVHAARRSGFRSIGIDLIYGIPGQDLGQWTHTVDAACALRPDHLSLYSLSLDEGSRLAEDVRRGLRTLPDDDLSARMYEEAGARLRSSGYRQYEISNFALPAHECLHNQHYWERGEYLGLGPSAWSFLGEHRCSNVADVQDYIERIGRNSSAVSFQELLSRAQAATEAVLLGLRRASGIDRAVHIRQYGSDLLDAVLRRATALAAPDLVEITDDVLRLTSRGMLLSNTLIAELLA